MIVANIILREKVISVQSKFGVLMYIFLIHHGVYFQLPSICECQLLETSHNRTDLAYIAMKHKEEDARGRCSCMRKIM